MITKEDYEMGEKYYETIRKIITNQSCSFIPIEYIEFLRRRGYSTCNCNSGVFNGTSKFYNEWLLYKCYEEDKGKKETDSDVKGSTRRNRKK